MGCLRLNIDNSLAWLENSSTGKVKTDSLIVGDVKNSLRDALASGTILPFSSKQIEIVLTLDLLSSRSGLSFFRNKIGERLEETRCIKTEVFYHKVVFL